MRAARETTATESCFRPLMKKGLRHLRDFLRCQRHWIKLLPPPDEEGIETDLRETTEP